MPLSIDDLRIAVRRLEDDLQTAKGTNRRLHSQRNQAQGSLEMVLRGKAPEIESALAKQEARLKEEFLAEHNSIMGRRSTGCPLTTRLSCRGSGTEPGSLGGKQP